MEPWKYRKLLHQGKNEKNGIAEAIPFLSCPTMFSYREAPLENLLQDAQRRVEMADGFKYEGDEGDEGGT